MEATDKFVRRDTEVACHKDHAPRTKHRNGTVLCWSTRKRWQVHTAQTRPLHMPWIFPRALERQWVRTDPSPALLQRMQSLQIRWVNVSVRSCNRTHCWGQGLILHFQRKCFALHWLSEGQRGREGEGKAGLSLPDISIWTPSKVRTIYCHLPISPIQQAKICSELFSSPAYGGAGRSIIPDTSSRLVAPRTPQSPGSAGWALPPVLTHGCSMGAEDLGPQGFLRRLHRTWQHSTAVTWLHTGLGPCWGKACLTWDIPWERAAPPAPSSRGRDFLRVPTVPIFPGGEHTSVCNQSLSKHLSAQESSVKVSKKEP